MRTKARFFLALLWIFIPVSSIRAFETHQASLYPQSILSLNVIKIQLGQGNFSNLSTHPWLTVKSIESAVGGGGIEGDMTEIVLGSIAEDFDLASDISSQSVPSHTHYTEFSDENKVLLPYLGNYSPPLSPQDAIHSDRAQNHFYSGGYSPLATNGQAGRLNDPKLLNSTLANRVFNLSTDRESAVYWALNSSINGAGLSSINGQTPTSRKFRILGHLLHLLQDMGVPEHVRDDAHAISVGGPSPYEDRLGVLTFEQHETWASGMPSMAPVTRNDPYVYFEELADYTRTHFFSSDTIFSTTTGISLEPHYSNWNFNEMIGFDRYVTGQNGGTTVRLARYTMLGRLRLRSYTETLGGFSITTTQVVPYPNNYTEAAANKDFFTVNDDGIVQDYWLVMKPRILAYCAGFIDKFIGAYITPGLPPVQTLAATSIATNGATLNGSVNPNGLPTNYWFEYGTSPTLATYSSTPTKSGGSGTTSQSFSEPISGLQAGTPYYFRIAASNSGGTAKGTIDGFSTGTGTSTKWTKTFGFGANRDYGTSVQQTINGGFIVAGVTSSWGLGDDNAYLIRTDSSGNALWAKTYGEGISNDMANAVQQTSDGGFVFAGTTWSNIIAGGENIYLVKTDSGGNTVWTKTYDGVDDLNDGAYSVRQTSDGGFIIAGGTTIYTGAPDYFNLDYLLMKTDANGNIIWSKSYGGSRDDIAKSVQLTLDGGYIIVGTSASFGGAYLVKTDTNGNMVWSKAYDLYADGTSGVSVYQTPDGGYIVVGTAGYGNAGGYNYADVLLVKTDGSGNVLWSKRHRNNGGGNLYVTGAQPTLDGGYIISGYLESFTTNVFLMKTNLNGDLIWLKTFGVGFGYSVQQTLDGGYIIVGGAAYDVYLIKTDSNGDTLP